LDPNGAFHPEVVPAPTEIEQPAPVVISQVLSGTSSSAGHLT